MGPAAEAQSRKDHHFDNSFHVSFPVNEPCALNRNRYSKDRTDWPLPFWTNLVLENNQYSDINSVLNIPCFYYWF